VEAVPVPGKLPIHLEASSAPDAEDSVGVRIRETRRGTVLAYFSGVGGVTPAVAQALEDADAVFFDGTFWSEDELPALGVGDKRARDMAHAPLGGPHGSLTALGALRASRRILIHLNNTNPLLREDSPERAQVSARGWEVAYDGMEVSL
jgi:pyrroloquinoline quinone biosynthesis protein B